MSRYTKPNSAKVVMIAALMASSIGMASASDRDEVDAKLMANIKVDMLTAISTAQTSANGKATRAKLEIEDQKPAYEIEVVSDNKVTDFKIDAMTGAILRSKEDKPD